MFATALEFTLQATSLVLGSGVPITAICHSSFVQRCFPAFAHICPNWNQSALTSGCTVRTEQPTSVVPYPVAAPAAPVPQVDISNRSIQKSPTFTISSVCAEPFTASKVQVAPDQSVSFTFPCVYPYGQATSAAASGSCAEPDCGYQSPDPEESLVFTRVNVSPIPRVTLGG